MEMESLWNFHGFGANISALLEDEPFFLRWTFGAIQILMWPRCRQSSRHLGSRAGGLVLPTLQSRMSEASEGGGLGMWVSPMDQDFDECLKKLRKNGMTSKVGENAAKVER